MEFRAQLGKPILVIFLLGEGDFGNFFAWSFAWAGFAWGCDAGMFT